MKRSKVTGLVLGTLLLVSNAVFANEYVGDDTSESSSEQTIVGETNAVGISTSSSISFSSSSAVSVSIPTTVKEATGQSIPQTINFTGLVLDATGFGVDRTFSPTVKDDTGRVIYGLNIPKDVVSRGMMDYIAPNTTIETSRAGSNPMVIKVLGLYRNNTSFVISKQDADILLFVDSTNNFLSKTAVVVKY